MISVDIMIVDLIFVDLCSRSYVFVFFARRAQREEIAESWGKCGNETTSPNQEANKEHLSSEDAQDHESRRQNGEAIVSIHLL